jgi:hypothetical protein
MPHVIKKLTGAEAPDLDAVLHDLAALRDDVSGMTKALTKQIAETVTTRNGVIAARAVGHQLVQRPVLGLVAAFALGVIGAKLLRPPEA